MEKQWSPSQGSHLSLLTLLLQVTFFPFFIHLIIYYHYINIYYLLNVNIMQVWRSPHVQQGLQLVREAHLKACGLTLEPAECGV